MTAPNHQGLSHPAACCIRGTELSLAVTLVFLVLYGSLAFQIVRFTSTYAAVTSSNYRYTYPVNCGCYINITTL
jgi:hypothetical protein